MEVYGDIKEKVRVEGVFIGDEDLIPDLVRERKET